MNYGKLSLTLSSLVREYLVPDVPMNGALPRPQALSVLPDKMEVTVFIHCDETADLSGLPGVKMHSDGKTVRTATVDFQNPTIDLDGSKELDGLFQLAENEKVKYISSSVRLTPLNDIAAVKAGLTSFRDDHGDLTGEGVVIGIIDSGIDSSHPAFEGRIHSIWDQVATGNGIDGGPSYGQFLTDGALAGNSDDLGHGTQIAGVAAGSDRQFGGVARRATIVVVKTDFQTAHIADAIRHVFTIADELKAPAVVNLSAGGQLDSHDGEDDLSRFIAQELKGTEGKVVVAAAGNEGANKTHAKVVLPALSEANPTPKRISHFEILDGSKILQLILRAWNSPGGEGLIRLINPSGTAVAETRLPVDITGFSPDNILAVNHLPYTDGKSKAFAGETLVPCYLNKTHEMLIDTRRDGGLEPGKWKLEVENLSKEDLTVDIWLWTPEGSRKPEFASEINAQSEKIGSPGSSDDAITVASYTTRGDGLLVQEDVISLFSSPGPLRDKRPKPDVAAPGALIMSARSGSAHALVLKSIGSGFTTGAGTSMAAAFITGVCALLLQNNPKLTHSAVKAWLKENSHIPGQPEGHDNKWGYGLLDLSNVALP